MTELAWDWSLIARVLFWRLAPRGTTITRKDLHALPMDKVLIEDREPTCIRLRFVTLAEAERLRTQMAAVGQKATVSEMQGRWQKIAMVLLWKLAKDGITLTPADLSAVPDDQMLLAHGHANDIEYRFLPIMEALAIAKHEKDNEGRILL
jgi:hypothetical protein